jgi:hypothetical protein
MWNRCCTIPRINHYSNRYLCSSNPPQQLSLIAQLTNLLPTYFLDKNSSINLLQIKQFNNPQLYNLNNSNEIQLNINNPLLRSLPSVHYNSNPNTYYSILFFDIGSEENLNRFNNSAPYYELLWLILNLTDVNDYNSGSTVIPYNIPYINDNQPHYLYYILLEQNNILDAALFTILLSQQRQSFVHNFNFDFFLALASASANPDNNSNKNFFSLAAAQRIKLLPMPTAPEPADKEPDATRTHSNLASNCMPSPSELTAKLFDSLIPRSRKGKVKKK